MHKYEPRDGESIKTTALKMVELAVGINEPLSDREYAELEAEYRKVEDQLAQQDLQRKENPHVPRPPSSRPL